MAIETTPEPFEKSSGVPDSSGDIVVTDKELFDHAIADTPAKPEPAAKAEAPQAPTPQQPDEAGRLRDEQGRFAPKQPQAATTQQPAPQQPQPQPQQPQQRQPEDHRVPVATLLQERERAYRAEAELQQMRQAWAQWQQQQQLAQQQPQQPAPQTIYDDPDAYLTQRYMQPLRQEGMRMIAQVKDDMSRELANQQFGQQQVDAALESIAQIKQTPHGQFVLNQLTQSGHPYAALVKWHGYQRAQQQIGNDPEAWFRQRANQLLDDPRFQAAAIERARTRAQQQPQGNGRPPNVQLPPSLSSLPATTGRLDDEGDMSNDSLYKFATR